MFVDLLKAVGVGLVSEMISEQQFYTDFFSVIIALKTGDAFKEVQEKESFSWTFVEY